MDTSRIREISHELEWRADTYRDASLDALAQELLLLADAADEDAAQQMRDEI